MAAGHSRLSRPLLLLTSLCLMLGDWQKAVQRVSPSQMASSKEEPPSKLLQTSLNRVDIIPDSEEQSVADTEVSSSEQAFSRSSSLSLVSNHSPSASAAAVAAAASGTAAAAAGQAGSGWVEFLRGLLGDPNGSSHSSWGPAVLTGEETCKRKGQAHGVKH